jgi:four helix bundle protein
VLRLNHKKLDVWILSINLTTKIYAITNQFPKSEVYGLTNQLRRAAVSVPSNIAEGAARKSKLERKRFFEIARSSLVEIDTQLEIAQNLKYMELDGLTELFEDMNHLFAKLSKLILKV